MIARLEGILFERTPTRVVLDVRGVGYEVFVPLSTYAVLPDEGKTVALRIYTHAREGTLALYGFASAAEQAAFGLLLRASRVGPKLAQAVLSGISPMDLLCAIRDRDGTRLRAAPGVGPKLAERIVVELRDRAEELAAALAGEPSAEQPDSAAREAVSALQILGYSRSEAERVLADVQAEVGADAGVEAYLRGALRRLSR